MRSRSFVGPVLLVLVGGLLLYNNIRPDLPVFNLIATWWPVLLILWGFLRLVEMVVSPAARRPSGGFGAGQILLIVLISVAGSGLWVAHRHGIRFPARGLDMFGETYDYDVSAARAAGSAKRIVFQHPRGNLRVVGADTQEVKITGRQTIRAFNRTEADRAHGEASVIFTEQGEQLVVHTRHGEVRGNLRSSADLEVTVPRGSSVEIAGRTGDFEVNGVSGNVEITGDNSDVRLNGVGGNTRVTLRRSGLVRAVDLAGDLELQGRGSDVDLENIKGQVTVNGSYGGTLTFRNLAKPLHFESPNTDLRVAALPGQITMDLGELRARNVVGPVRLVTRSKDIKITEFTQSLELETDRGDIELQPDRVPLARIEARSRAGRIDLVLPEKASFDLRATTGRGEAVNDFGPPIEKETDGRSATLRGKTGSGPEIRLNTERGSLSVRKGSAEVKL